MIALELADMLVSKEVLLVNDQVCEAATMLRRQHEAIVKLRVALRMLNGIASTYPCSLHQKHSSVVDAEQALKDTEDLK